MAPIDEKEKLPGSSSLGDESDSGTVTEKEKADEARSQSSNDNDDEHPSVHVAADEFGRDIEAQGVSTELPFPRVHNPD